MKQFELTSSQHSNITKWLISLRSGKYKQCEENLRNESGFCCLGVACEIQGIEHSGLHGFMFDAFYMTATPDSNWFKNTYGFCPSHLMNSDKDGSDVSCLADMNDVHKFNFEKIADVIEFNILNNYIIKN
jgi:hypothetical protein